MKWLKHATILSMIDWENHITVCNTEQSGDHIAVVSGSIMPGAATSYPNPPFLCYAILQQETDMSGEISYRWVHTCFTAIDAGIIAAHNMDVYEATMKKKREELEANASERQQQLLDDLDFETEETLKPISLREAMEMAEERAKESASGG